MDVNGVRKRRTNSSGVGTMHPKSFGQNSQYPIWTIWPYMIYKRNKRNDGDFPFTLQNMVIERRGNGETTKTAIVLVSWDNPRFSYQSVGWLASWYNKGKHVRQKQNSVSWCWWHMAEDQTLRWWVALLQRTRQIFRFQLEGKCMLKPKL